MQTITMQTITMETDPRGVTSLTLNAPERHNALGAEMIAELTEAARYLGNDTATRVVVLSGAGKSFCAGGDLRWMQAQMAAGDAERERAARALAQMLFALNTLPKPLIGRIQGNAFGGGVGLACVCDIALADDRARFGLTETRLGLIPATIGPYVLARMGEANARQVFMSSLVFGARRAERLGIIAQALPAAELDAAIAREVAPYLSCAPRAVAAAKALSRQLGPTIDEAVIEASIGALIQCWNSGEAAKGIAAFFDKRPADWAPQDRDS